MPQAPYYPEYHSDATHAGPVSHMPAFFWQSPATILWQIFTIPTTRRPRYKRQKANAPSVGNPGAAAVMRTATVPSVRQETARYSAPGAASATVATAQSPTCGYGMLSDRPGGPAL